MKIIITPVIFRCFGREKDETSSLLFGYVTAGDGIIRIGSQSREISTRK